MSRTDIKRPDIPLTKANPSDALTQSIINSTLIATQTVSATDPTNTNLNAAEMLRSIEIPKELRFKPQEAAKYQMEMLRKKVSSESSSII